MAGYIVDDAGSGTSPFETWAKAATSLDALLAAVTIAAGDIVYVGHNHVDQKTYSANHTFSGPTSGLPCTVISVTQGTGSVGGGGFTFQQATADQISTNKDGAYTITFDGSWALYGIQINSGHSLTFKPDSNEGMLVKSCELKVGNTRDLIFNSAGTVGMRCHDCTLNLTNDSGATAGDIISFTSGYIELIGLTITNGTNRTGACLTAANSAYIAWVSGCDFSGLTNATPCEIVDTTNGSGFIYVEHCKTAATYTPLDFTANVYPGCQTLMTDVGSGVQPAQLSYMAYQGDIEADTSITRTGGASIEGTAVSWGGPTAGIETNASCGVDHPLRTPWIYGVIEATGTYALDVFIVNDTADFDDDEVWLEVEYLDDVTSGQWTRADDAITTRLTTPAAQTDDTGSTWSGTGPSYTFKQKLSVPGLTVGTVGLFRARVCVGLASIASSRNFYIDPKVVVT
jgi:hypothetical protein